MRYFIDVIDGGGSRTAILTGLTAARLREKVNDFSILTIETADREKWEAIHPGATFLTVRDRHAETSSTFRVIESAVVRAGERRRYAATARHIIADTADETVAEAADVINHTPRELMERVLAHSRFGCGAVEPTGTVPYVRFEYEPVWDCLKRICSLTGGEIALDEDTGEIGLFTRIGADGGASFRYGRNLRGVTRTIGVSALANRIYGIGGGNPPLTIAGAAASGGLPYVEDAASVARWGRKSAVCHEPALEAVTNLVTTPAFDGPYTDGLCAGWTKTAGASVSREIDPSRCLYGLASQRVETTGANEGIRQQVAVTPGRIYSLLANLFIVSGVVRVRVIDGTAAYRRAEAVAGEGLATVRIENWKALTASVTLEIVQEGAGSAIFAVDSAQIAEGAAVKPFACGNTADTLYDRAKELLDARKNPVVSYEVDLALAVGVTPEGEGVLRTIDRFALGDTVRVFDLPLGIDVKARVMERDENLLDPASVTVRLDSAVRTVADVIAALREAETEGIRRMRAVGAESSSAAETGSSRLGFSRQAFRFYGTVAAAGWNALSWSAGTFRAGDCYFPIGAGSLSGFPGYAIIHIYFDRTNPATFGATLDAAAAEGADRIHVFTATTTASPELCRIHAAGVVTG